MKILTNKKLTKKILIVILIVMSFNFVAPKPVQADIGGILVSPITALLAVITDAVQKGLSWGILGEVEDFMRPRGDARIIRRWGSFKYRGRSRRTTRI